MVFRLRAPGRPFIAYDPGMTRDALAYYGCAELFQVLDLIYSICTTEQRLQEFRSLKEQCFKYFDVFYLYMKDVHTELIQHRRLWMLKRGIVKGNLTVDSNTQRLNGSCPLMPEEVNFLK